MTTEHSRTEGRRFEDRSNNDRTDNDRRIAMMTELKIAKSKIAV